MLCKPRFLAVRHLPTNSSDISWSKEFSKQSLKSTENLKEVMVPPIPLVIDKLDFNPILLNGRAFEARPLRKLCR